MKRTNTKPTKVLLINRNTRPGFMWKLDLIVFIFIFLNSTTVVVLSSWHLAQLNLLRYKI